MNRPANVFAGFLALFLSACVDDPPPPISQPKPDAHATFSFDDPTVVGTVPVGVGVHSDGTQQMVVDLGPEALLVERASADDAWGDVSRLDATAFAFLVSNDIAYVVAGIADDSSDRLVLLRSEDGGETWQERGDIAGIDEYTSKNSVELVANSTGELFVLVSDELYRSDTGESWAVVDRPSDERVVVLHVGADDNLYLRTAGDSTLYRSTDGGDSWQPFVSTTPAPDSFALLEHPDGGLQYAYAADYEAQEKVWLSRDGVAWTEETYEAPCCFHRTADFFFAEDSLHLVLSSDEDTVVMRRGTTDWESIYQGEQGASGLFVAGTIAESGTISVVQGDLQTSIREAQITSESATETNYRLKRSFARIRGGFVQQMGDEAIVGLAVEAEPGPEGGMDAWPFSWERVDLHIFASTDHENWEERSVIANIRPPFGARNAASANSELVLLVQNADSDYQLLSSTDGARNFTTQATIDGIVELPPSGLTTDGAGTWLAEIAHLHRHVRTDSETWTMVPPDPSRPIRLAAVGPDALVGVDPEATYELDGDQWRVVSDDAPTRQVNQADEQSLLDPARANRMVWAGEAYWIFGKGGYDWSIWRGVDGAWSNVDTRNDMTVVDLVHDPSGYYFYGTSRVDARLSYLVGWQTSVVVRRSAEGTNNFVYVEPKLPEAIGFTQTFLDADVSGGSHLVLMAPTRADLAVIAQVSYESLNETNLSAEK